MKETFKHIPLLLVLLISTVKAQPVSMFFDELEHNSSETVLMERSNGEIWVATNSVQQYSDANIYRLSALGDTISTLSYTSGSYRAFYINAMKERPDGNIVLAAKRIDLYGNLGLMMLIDENGTILQNYEYRSTSENETIEFFDIEIGTDNSIFFSASYYDAWSGGVSFYQWYSPLIGKLDANLNPSWTSSWGVHDYGNKYRGYGRSLCFDNNGDLIVYGTHSQYQSNSTKYLFLAKYDVLGNKLWSTDVQSTRNEKTKAVTTTSNGSIYSLSNVSNNEFSLEKFTSSGVLIWSKSYSSGLGDLQMEDISIGANQKPIIVGSFETNGRNHPIVILMDTTGVVLTAEYEDFGYGNATHNHIIPIQSGQMIGGIFGEMYYIRASDASGITSCSQIPLSITDQTETPSWGTAISTSSYAAYISGNQGLINSEASYAAISCTPPAPCGALISTYDTICEGKDYAFNGSDLTVSGTYLDTLPNMFGCDSIVEVHLFFEKMTTELFDTLYNFETYFFNDQLLNTSGVYWDTMATTSGCDSFIKLDIEFISNISFGYQWSFPSGNGPYDLATSDLNGDGLVDMVACNYEDNSISVFQNQTGVFNPALFSPSFQIPVLQNPSAIEIGDVDGDGFEDLVVTNRGSDSISIILNLGLGGTMNIASFAVAEHFICGDEPMDLKIEDLDGDGLKDIGIANFEEKTISLLRNLSTPGSLAFSPQLKYNVNEHVSTIHLVDLNGDSKSDILINSPDHAPDRIKYYTYENFSVVGGLAFGTAVPHWDWSRGTSKTWDVIPADVNNDGCLDMISVGQGNFYGAHNAIDSSFCLTGIMDDEFYDEQNYLYQLQGNNSYMVDNGFRLAISDFNLDGNMDYTFLYRNPSPWTTNLMIMDNVNNGQFDVAQSYPITYSYTGHPGISTDGTLLQINIEAEDFDNDGKDEIAFINYFEDRIEILGNTSLIDTNDFADTINVLTILSDTNHCLPHDSVIQVSFEANGSFVQGNLFYLELSDPTGSFSSPTLLGLINSPAPSGNINGILPSNLPTGSNYMLRVRSGYPILTSIEVGPILIYQPVITPLSSSICIGDSFSFYGQELSLAGQYDELFVASSGCDSIVRLNLSVSPLPVLSITATDTILCKGETITLTASGADNYNWDPVLSNGAAFSPPSSAVYEVIGSDSIGCEGSSSIFIIVNSPKVSIVEDSICGGDSLFLEGVFQTQAGSYVDTLIGSASNGCDSIIITTLSILTTPIEFQTASICPGESIVLGGQTQTTAGTYSDTLQNASANGCDSIITTTLTILNPQNGTATASICPGGSIVLGGQLQTTAGIYSDTLIGGASNGCDSIITTTLTILNPQNGTATASICPGGSIVLGGQTQTTAGTYSDTLIGGASNGCDSIITTTLSILNPQYGTAVASICPGESIVLGGQTQTTTGAYSDTLIGGAINGCDSIITTTLSILNPQYGTATASICPGESIVLGGQTQTMGGTYVDTLSNGAANGCDSIITTTLSILNPQYGTATASICPGENIVLGGQAQTTAGTYVDTLQNGAANGCDSILTTTLTILNLQYGNTTASICPGESIVLSGQVQTTAGSYVDTLFNAASNGCDSIITTALALLSPHFANATASICPGESIVLGGQAQTTAGSYVDTLFNAASNGCDSILTTTLTLLSPHYANATASICPGGSIVLGGQTQTTAGSYVDTLFNASTNGCDSIITTTLTILNLQYGTTTTSICPGGSIVLGGQTQTTAGSYIDTLFNTGANGCDSIITTTLTIIPTVYGTDTVSICPDDEVYLAGEFQFEEGNYVDTLFNASENGCDSVLTTTLLIEPYFQNVVLDTICMGDSLLIGSGYQSTSGNYLDTIPSTLEDYCDTILTTELFVKNCSIIGLQNEVKSDWEVSIFPNPSQGEVFIQISSKKDLLLPLSIQVFDLRAKLVYEDKIIQQNKHLQLGHLSNGLYLLKVGESHISKLEIIRE